jgi:hypothetical protein
MLRTGPLGRMLCDFEITMPPNKSLQTDEHLGRSAPSVARR